MNTRSSLLILCLLFLGQNALADERISFLTYNLFHIHSKDYNPIVKFPVSNATRKERVPLQAQELKASSATFILLQEAFHDESRLNLVNLMEPEYGVINNDSYNIKSGLIQFGSGLLILYKKSQVTYIEGTESFKAFPYKHSTASEKLFS